MNIRDATAGYESWLGKRIQLIAEDLDKKHHAMACDPFCFLRATFYRWMQLWPEVCKECSDAPYTLAVGDLHVENFGTWRDVEGRLVWGINDFDEAYELPYTLDLVRLAASAHLAIHGAHLALEARDACEGILDGYRKGLACGGHALVLEEHHDWLRSMVSGVLRDPKHFWEKLDALPALKRPIPAGALGAMERMMPAPRLTIRVVHRVAGLGSLGRERYLAIAEYAGGKVAREAKALAPSACLWANGAKASAGIRYQDILERAVRSLDPFVKMKSPWIVRRLAPDCSRVELASMPKQHDELRLLRSMGFETANVHLGTHTAVDKIAKDLRKRPRHWLHRAAEAMVKATMADWHEWHTKGDRA